MFQRFLQILTLLPFGALSAMALMSPGYRGSSKPHFQGWEEGQVLADLVIALTLVMAWIWRDAGA